MSHLNHLQNELSAYLVDAYMFGPVTINSKMKVIGLPDAIEMFGADYLIGTFKDCLYFIVEDRGEAHAITGVHFDDLESMKIAADKIRGAIEGDVELPKPGAPVEVFVGIKNADELINLRRKNPGALFIHDAPDEVQ